MSKMQKHIPRGHPVSEFIGKAYQQLDKNKMSTVCMECSVSPEKSRQYSSYFGVGWCPFCKEVFSFESDRPTQDAKPLEFIRTRRNNFHWCEAMEELNAQEICLHAKKTT